jgi:hypothetical protein
MSTGRRLSRHGRMMRKRPLGPMVHHGLLDRVGDLGPELVSVNATLEPASSAPSG